MLKAFKSFDAHIKAVDGVNQKTVIGAIITIISFVVVISLLVSELSIFLNVETVSRMVADTSVGVQSIKLEVDISFYDVPCEFVTFQQELTRGTLHLHEPGQIHREPIDFNGQIGCRLIGETLTDKVGGNFRFAIAPQDVPNVPDQPKPMRDFSHRVNHVAFEPTNGPSAADKFPEFSPLLNQHEVLIKDSDIALYQYAMLIVPTEYKTLYGDLSFANQYSVVEKSIAREHVRATEAASALFLGDFSGVIFTYDFHPVMLYMEERREHTIDFISNLFGIIGGVIAILSLAERIIYSSTKALIGKKD